MQRTRIGEQYGFSGEIYRITAAVENGDTTLIAKVESAARTQAAVTAHRFVSGRLGRSIPDQYGHRISGDRGLILQEDIDPAIQGDELTGCTSEQAREIVALVAKLHLSTRMEAPPEGVNTFITKTSEPERWSATLTRAVERYPDLFTSDRVERLADFPIELAGSAQFLDREPLSWIHVDPHLDNILWRDDGSPVLIDWSNARVGPPVVDVAALLIGYSFRSNAPLEADRLIHEYAELAGNPRDQIRTGAAAAVKPLFIQGGIGWAGEESNTGFVDRKGHLRNEMASRVLRALDWVDQI